MSVIFSLNPCRSAKSAIWFVATFSHVKLLSLRSAMHLIFGLLKGLTIPIALALQAAIYPICHSYEGPTISGLLTPASGDMFDMSLSASFKRVKPVKPARGDMSVTASPARYSSFKPVNPAIGVRSDIIPSAKIYLLQLGQARKGRYVEMA